MPAESKRARTRLRRSCSPILRQPAAIRTQARCSLAPHANARFLPTTWSHRLRSCCSSSARLLFGSDFTRRSVSRSFLRLRPRSSASRRISFGGRHTRSSYMAGSAVRRLPPLPRGVTTWRSTAASVRMDARNAVHNWSCSANKKKIPKLSSVQQLEEKIGSVDYDVWICPACLNNDTERYINTFSSFRDCPKCKARTYKEDPQKTLIPATTISSGEAQIEGRCVSCNYKSIRKVTLPMIVDD